MGKLFFYLLLSLLAATILSFVLGFHTAGYILGAIFGMLAMGIGYIYSSKDEDKNRVNHL